MQQAVFFFPISRTATGFRVIILESEHKHSRYANMALAGWDYTLNDEKMVQRKHKSIYQEIVVRYNENMFARALMRVCVCVCPGYDLNISL